VAVRLVTNCQELAGQGECRLRWISGNEPDVTNAAQPIFLLSFRHRDELAAMAERGGWQAIAARRAEGAEWRFVASGAPVAVIDARGAFEAGLAVTRLLAEPAEANAAALVVLVSRKDVARLDQLFAAGASHYLASPFSEAEFVQTLRFAARYAERMAGGRRAATGRAALLAAEAATWHWLPGTTTAALSPVLARRLGIETGVDGSVPLRRLLVALGRDARRLARDAVVRSLEGARPTAFAHGVDGARVAHHIHTGSDGAVIGRVEELEQARRAEDRGSRDSLTGLDDGPAVRRWIERCLRGSGEAGTSSRCILILLSVSRFDAINAAFGKATGDAVLQAVARRIERVASATRPRDRSIARIAGAEFAIALAAPATIEEGDMIATRLVEAVGRPFVADHRMVNLSCRVGVALAGEGETDSAALLRRASAALAEAKGGEAGAVRILDVGGEAESAREDRLEIDLRVALDRDEIELLFQPQVSVTTGAIVGVEALARWRHPQLGELGAATLFAVAERSDYLVQLSDHVQHKAVQIAAAWPDALAHLRLAVNVTAQDIAQPGFAARFLEMVDASGFARSRLTVEVTESGLIEDLAEAAALLATLRAAGLRAAIDDFGTGYSSLVYLKALPLDYLKIDKRLAQDIEGSARDRVVVRGVIDMARALGLAVVAEGVETEAQLALLAAEGCNYYQGFLCAPPIAVEELARRVSEGRRVRAGV